MPLPRLRAAGLLWHRIGEVEFSQPQGEFLMPLAIAGRTRAQTE